MEKKLQKTVLLVDYENIQNIPLSALCEENIDIKIFVGQFQSKIPLELVQETQRFGQRLEWIKIEGVGSNALDFHIAFYLGKLSNNISNVSFAILSKDKGFDPLVKYVNKQQVNCTRIQNLRELSAKDKLPTSEEEELVNKVIENLYKIQKNKRPRTRKTLRQHIKSLLQKQLSEQELDNLIESMFANEQLTEVNNRIAYNF